MEAAPGPCTTQTPCPKSNTDRGLILRGPVPRSSCNVHRRCLSLMHRRRPQPRLANNRRTPSRKTHRAPFAPRRLSSRELSRPLRRGREGRRRLPINQNGRCTRAHSLHQRWRRRPDCAARDHNHHTNQLQNSGSSPRKCLSSSRQRTQVPRKKVRQSGEVLRMG